MLLVLAAAGAMSLHNALWAGIWILIVTLGLFAFLAARNTRLSPIGKLLLVAALMGLGGLVVLVKMLAH